MGWDRVTSKKPPFWEILEAESRVGNKIRGAVDVADSQGRRGKWVEDEGKRL